MCSGSIGVTSGSLDAHVLAQQDRLRNPKKAFSVPHFALHLWKHKLHGVKQRRNHGIKKLDELGVFHLADA